LHVAPQREVVAAGLRQKGSTGLNRPFERGVEDPLNRGPAIGHDSEGLILCGNSEGWPE
jgi:hypothetical protein